MTTFRPTYLYIKQHNKTEKLYFGKTVRDPLSYRGSGKHWISHIEWHGKTDVSTLWYCLFCDEETINEFSLMCSRQWGIVESEEWLNLIEETGIGDTTKTLEARAKMRAAKLGKKLVLSEERKLQLKEQMTGNTLRVGTKLSDAHRAAFVAGLTGRVLSDDAKERIGAANRGQIRSEERRLNMSKARKGTHPGPYPKSTCPHCNKTGGNNLMSRYHFNNCKQLQQP